MPKNLLGEQFQVRRGKYGDIRITGKNTVGVYNPHIMPSILSTILGKRGSKGKVKKNPRNVPAVKGPLQNRNINAMVCGNPDLVQRSLVLHMRPAGGWKFKSSTYRDARRYFSPLILKLGDCMTTDLTELNTTPPGWLTSGAFATDNADFFRMWHSSQTLAKAAGTKDATLRLTGSSNMYSDFCIPVFPLDGGAVNLEGQTVSQAPITINKIFERPSNDGSNGGHYNHALNQWGAGPYYLDADGMSGTDMMPVPNGAGGTLESSEHKRFATNHAFVSLQTEFRIYNSRETAMTYDLYVCSPRYMTHQSPLFTYDIAHKLGSETRPSFDKENAAGAASQHLYVGTSPEEYKDFNKVWKYTKKTVVIPSGHCMLVNMRLPMSLVKNEIIQKMVGTSGNASIPGLTQWFWVRCYGNLGYDRDAGLGGYSPGTLDIQMYQKVNVLYSIPHINKKINIVRVSAAAVTADERLAQDDKMNQG